MSYNLTSEIGHEPGAPRFEPEPEPGEPEPVGAGAGSLEGRTEPQGAVRGSEILGRTRTEPDRGQSMQY